MKKKLILCMAGILCFTCGTIIAQNDTKIYVNGNRISGEAFIKDDRTYVPLRAVSEAMGAEVSWDSGTQSAYVNFTEDDAVSQIVENVSPSVVAIVGNYYKYSTESSKYNNSTAHGTGAIIKSNGTIITNYHVVKDIENLTVVLYDGTSVSGRVLYSDEDIDLAVVKIEKIGLKPIEMANKEDIIAGRTAIAIGTPVSLSMRNSVTKGIVSIPNVSIKGSMYELIQTDTPINPGNSGGPLLNMKGQMIGINSSKYASSSIDSIAFAIPIDTVKFALNQFETNGRILRPNTDIEFEESWEAKLGIPTNKGLTVKSSADASIKAGDIITKINDVNVHSTTEWNEIIKDTFDGTSLAITFERDGGEQTVTIYPTIK